MGKLRFIAAAVVGLIAVGSQPVHTAWSAERPPTPVEAMEVSTEPLVIETTAVGTLLSNETVIVRPEIEGRIVEIQFEEGGTVDKDQVLFKLDDSIYGAELSDARARLELATTNFDRAKELLQKNAGTARGRDEARSDYRVAQAALELARARLSKTTIKAPFEGIVGLRHVSTGDYVTAGQDLVNLEDLSPLKVEFSVPERYLGEVKEGQTVRLSVDAFPARTFDGTIYAINPQIDTASRSIQVRARVPNEDRELRPGLFTRVKVQLGKRDRAIMIPEQALVPRGKERLVFKVVEGKAVAVDVKIGQRRYGAVEIVDGLVPGDVVVTAGQLKIRNGAPVKLVGAEEETEGNEQPPTEAGESKGS